MKKLIFVVLCLSSLVCTAEGLPDLGDVSQSAISPRQEREIGQQSMFEIRANKTYLDDPEINDYLNQIGYQLAANSSDPSLGFEFFAINDNAINAFSLPGGFVGVNTGLILITQSESELASVLAHEISHATQHHIIRMLAGQKLDSLTSMVAMAIAILAARNNPQAAQAAIMGSQGAAIQRQLNFSRANEEEADRIGMATLQKSGFDAHAMPAFLERMQKATRLMENDTPSYFRTHPITSERVADIANRAEQIPYHLVPDSLNFHLVRAKLQFMQRTPQEAIAYFSDGLGTQKYGNQIAQRYGLALALLASGQAINAKQAFIPLQEEAMQNPMLATLEGKIKQANKSKDTIEFYRNATQNFPQHHALSYDYAELLLKDKRYNDAIKLLNEQIISEDSDVRLYELQARSYAALNKPQEEHHALAYTYALRGNLHGAIDQLELAKKAGSDYYQLSTIESELKEFREVEAAYGKQ